MVPNSRVTEAISSSVDMFCSGEEDRGWLGLWQAGFFVHEGHSRQLREWPGNHRPCEGGY